MVLKYQRNNYDLWKATPKTYQDAETRLVFNVEEVPGISNDLADVSYIGDPDQAVSFENNFEDTLVFIGSYGWREISTIKNMKLILKDLIIEIKTGNNTISILDEF